MRVVGEPGVHEEYTQSRGATRHGHCGEPVTQALPGLWRLAQTRGTTKRMPDRSSSIEHVLLSISPRCLAPGTSNIWLM